MARLIIMGIKGKRGVVKGTKMPSRYAGGSPYINLFVAILRQAKADKNVKYEDVNETINRWLTAKEFYEMWEEFIKTDIYKVGLKSGNVNSLDVASWVAEYLGLDYSYSRRF